MTSLYLPDEEDTVILNGFALVSQLSMQQNRPWRLGTKFKGDEKAIIVRVFHPENGTAMEIGLLHPLERTQLELIQDITDLFDVAEAIWKMWVDAGIALNPVHAASPNFGQEAASLEELDRKADAELAKARKDMENAFKTDPRVTFFWDEEEDIRMNGATWRMHAGTQEIPQVVAQYLSELRDFRDRSARGRAMFSRGVDLTRELRGDEQYIATRYIGERT